MKIDLGTFGDPNSAETQEFPYINNRGTVVGFADTATPDDTDEGFTFHAFRWRKGVMTDLGTLPGGMNSVANVVNNHDVAVGYSENSAREGVAVKGTKNGRIVALGTLGDKFLWQRGGRMIDLNAFVPPGSNLTIIDGETINDRGEIAGSGSLPNGDFHAVVLIPCNSNQSGKGCQ